jgi:hypothetical protein
MGDDLMAVEIEVHPMWAGATFFAAKEIEIERAAGVEVVAGEGEVEGLDGHGVFVVCAARGLLAGFPLRENDDIVGCNLIAPSRRSGEGRFMRAAREDDEVQ